MTLAGAGYLYGFASHRYEIFPHDQLMTAWRMAKSTMRGEEVRQEPLRGRWRAAPDGAAHDAARQDAERLGAIPYLSGYRPAGDTSGVTVWAREEAQDGLNLVVSGHGTEALLLAMDGEPVHRWRLPPVGEWSDDGPPADFDQPHTNYDFWRRALPLPGGDLLAIYEGAGVVRMDVRSRLRWSAWNGAHHDLALDPTRDGELAVLVRAPRVVERFGSRPILDDAVAWLDLETGDELRRVWISDALRDSDYAALAESVDLSDAAFAHHRGDLFHTNTLSVLDGRFAEIHPAFAAGHILVSLRELDTIAVIDPASGRVVWALTGLWHRQHEPTLVAPGRLLIFDNLAGGSAAEASRVVEVDPTTHAIVWSLDQGLFSRQLGAAHRLANGNTLVVESEAGRAVEVTPAREIVWEWRSPYRAGDNDELVATLCDLVRLEPSYLDGLRPSR